jgi:hypothetical protein
LGASGLFAVVTAVRSGALRPWWCVTAVALIALFIVEISPVHVEVDRVSHGKLVYLPLLAALVASLWRLTHCSDQRMLMWAGLAALTASYAVHLFGWDVVERLGFQHGSWPDQVKASIKEATELAGWLLLLVTLGRLATLDTRLGIAGKLARWAVGRQTERP